MVEGKYLAGGVIGRAERVRRGAGPPDLNKIK